MSRFTGPVLIEGDVTIDSDDTDGNEDGVIIVHKHYR